MSTPTDPIEPKSDLEKAVAAINAVFTVMLEKILSVFTRLTQPKYEYAMKRETFTMGEKVDILDVVCKYGADGWRVLNTKFNTEPSGMFDRDNNPINRIVVESYVERVMY